MNSTLYMPKVSMQDSGTYECVAENALGHVKKSASKLAVRAYSIALLKIGMYLFAVYDVDLWLSTKNPNLALGAKDKVMH